LAVDRQELRGFYFITDSTLTVNGILEDTRRALEAGVVLVQYREKEKGLPERLNEARQLLALCRQAGVPFIVNDDVEVAGKVGADGVHVGQEDASPVEARAALGAEAIVGVSVGSAQEAEAAEASGATYVSIGPVFETATKPDAGAAIGIEGVRAIRAATTLPLAAIGGLNVSNTQEVVEAGAAIICAISASLAEGRVKENIEKLRRAAGL
jgi:thiamine-phosphate pyrophosphorylase